MLDENVPAAVARYLTEQNREVIWSRDATGEGAPDPQVALAAQENGAILVSFDKDMSRIQRWMSPKTKERFPSLDLLMLNCSEPLAVERLKKFFEIILSEHNRVQNGNPEEPRIAIQVGNKKLCVWR